MLNLDALPAPLQKAVQHDSYDGGVATDISATSLIDSPRVKRLQRENKDKIQEDATRRIMALLGTTWHSLMEQNAPQGWIVEKRFYATTQRGLVVSGAIDALEPVGDKLNIRDYKVLTSWKAKKLGNLKPDDDEQFIRQLNIYAWLISKNGMTPNKLYVDALIRDWMDGKSKDAGYPDYPTMSYEIPMWPLDETEAHIESQLARHYGEELPRCTDEERWLRGGRYLVRKAGGKRNARVFDVEVEAQKYADNAKGDYEVLYEPGEAIRCERNFCGVADWCEQFKEEKND